MNTSPSPQSCVYQDAFLLNAIQSYSKLLEKIGELVYIALHKEDKDKVQIDSINSLLEEGKVYLERAKELDPARHTVDWAPPLYQIYYALNDKRAENIKKLIKY